MKIEKIFKKFEELLSLSEDDIKKEKKTKKIEKDILEKIDSCKEKIKQNSNTKEKEKKKIKILKKLLKKLK